jgi:protease I
MNDTATAEKTRPRADPRTPAGRLQGKTIAILATDGYERSELREPKQGLEKEGAVTEVIGPHPGPIKAWKNGEWADTIDTDLTLADADAARYDALVIPGGTINADHLRANGHAIEFVKSFFERHKPVGAICHGPWLLVEADVCRSRTLTSWPSLKTDIRNAGGEWIDQEVVRDDQLVTSRKPDDLPAFIAKLVELIASDAVEPRVRLKVAAPDVS